MTHPEAPRRHVAMLVSAPRRPPTRWQSIIGQVRSAWTMTVLSRHPQHLADLAIRPIKAMAGWLEGRVYIIDGRGNVSLNWKNPLAPIVAAALMPLGLVASVGIRVYLMLAGRRR